MASFDFRLEFFKDDIDEFIFVDFFENLVELFVQDDELFFDVFWSPGIVFFFRFGFSVGCFVFVAVEA